MDRPYLHLTQRTDGPLLSGPLLSGASHSYVTSLCIVLLVNITVCRFPGPSVSHFIRLLLPSLTSKDTMRPMLKALMSGDTRSGRYSQLTLTRLAH